MEQMWRRYIWALALLLALAVALVVNVFYLTDLDAPFGDLWGNVEIVLPIAVPSWMSEKGVCDDEYAGNFHHIDYYIIEGRDLTQNNWISLRFRTFDDQGRVRSCAGDVYESIAHGVDDSGVSVMAYGNVIDERNGSYIAEYYIPWSGIVSLQIQLYLPHDTTNILTHDLMTHDSGPVFMLAKLKLPWEQEVSCSPDHNSHIFNGAKGMKFTFPSGFMVYCKVENATTGNTLCPAIEDLSSGWACHGMMRAEHLKTEKDCESACCNVPECELFEFDPKRGCRVGVGFNCEQGESKSLSFPGTVRKRIRAPVTAELLEQLLPVLQYKATWSNEIAGHKYQAAAIARALKVIDKTLLEISTRASPQLSNNKSILKNTSRRWRLEGYWKGNHYIPLPGDTFFPLLTDQSLMECFSKYRFVYAIGDSTVRQLLEAVATVDGSTEALVELSRLRKQVELSSGSKWEFIFHGHPILGSYWMPLDNQGVTNDCVIIESIGHERAAGENGEDTLIILSLGHHFLTMPWHYVEQRFKELKACLVALHKRLPKLKVVFKNSNRREEVVQFFRFTNTHKLRHLNNLIQKHLPSFVRYIDIWPLTVQHPFSRDVHLPEPVILTQLNMVAHALECTA